MDKIQGIGFSYEPSKNKRQAVRVDMQNYRLVFHRDNTESYNCLDLSFTGTSLNGPAKYKVGESVKFVLSYKGKKVGVLIAQLAKIHNGSTSWKFLKMQSQVKNFIETLVLKVQKDELKEASEKRKAEEEAQLLGLKK